MTKDEKLELLRSAISHTDMAWEKIDRIPADPELASEVLIERALGNLTKALGQLRRAKSHVGQGN